MLLLALLSILSTLLLATASPIPPRLSADSIHAFIDDTTGIDALHYPALRDALFVFCRDVADLRREYEMSAHFRTRELRPLVVGKRLDAACAELPERPPLKSHFRTAKGSRTIYVGGQS